MVSLILPTNDRHDELALTLARVGSLDRAQLERIGGAELVVIDNGGGAEVPKALPNGLRVTLLREPSNRGAAARNTGAHAASGDWLLMLDDDSAPTDTGFVDVIEDAHPETAAIGAHIVLPRELHARGPLAGTPKREAGGLPEVVIGCGALIRREAFLRTGGYDPGFEYYVEEYDLCAKLLLAGHRVKHDHRFRVEHRKVEAGRDKARIVRLLVRNGGWFAARYAPEGQRDEAIRRITDRCAQIATKEGVEHGYTLGLEELERTVDQQERSPMSPELYECAIGMRCARDAVAHHKQQGALRDRVALVDRGKHDWCVEQALLDEGVEIVDPASDPAIPVMAATLSPGPLLDALDEHEAAADPALSPWLDPMGTRPTPLG